MRGNEKKWEKMRKNRMMRREERELINKFSRLRFVEREGEERKEERSLEREWRLQLMDTKNDTEYDLNQDAIWIQESK